jgi:hypothetical protein
MCSERDQAEFDGLREFRSADQLHGVGVQLLTCIREAASPRPVRDRGKSGIEPGASTTGPFGWTNQPTYVQIQPNEDEYAEDHTP